MQIVKITIFPNVIVGEGMVADDSVTLGYPSRDATEGEIPTRLGSGCVLRAGTIIYAGVTAGDGLQTGHGAVIREHNVLGHNCSVGTYAELAPGNTIGDNVRIHSGCFLELVTLGNNVFIGPHVVFTDDLHPTCPRYLDCVGGATVEDDVSIGANVTVLPGVRIGTGSLVGAGSVVTHDVPPGTVVAGNPARVVKQVRDLRCLAGLFERPYIWRENRQE